MLNHFNFCEFVFIQTSSTALKCVAKNVQSLRSDLSEMELLETLTFLSWDILFLNETWRDDREEIWMTDEGHLFLGSVWAGNRTGVAIS